MAEKILALTSKPIDAAALRSAVGDEVADGAEVLVVAPALNSRLRFWMSDPDPAIESARGVADETAERLEEEGIDAAADTGEADPLQAIDDALATFPADLIVLCTQTGDDTNWLEEGVVAEVRRRFGDQAVREIEIG